MCEDTLRIKNLPKELSETEKEDLLLHFGALQVNIITSSAKKKSVVFAKFDSKETAKHVMFRLHQMTILNCRLCVEFADHDMGYSGRKIKTENLNANDGKHFKLFIKKLNSWNNFSFHQPPPPHLKYAYPKPNRATINNIAHALGSVPKFYMQVLHLMNKMNLPPPFSNIPDSVNTTLRLPETPIVNTVIASEAAIIDGNSSESELASDTEESNKLNEVVPQKRKLAQKNTVKRPKFIKPARIPARNTKFHDTPDDVFEKVNMHVLPKIQLRLNTELLHGHTREESIQVIPEILKTADNEIDNGVISEQQLASGRIPLKDLSILPVFKDYHPGVPTCKLYIKNIAKAVELKDLEYIYKRYNQDTIEENEPNLFNIKLLKEGRMKGQAFITLNKLEQAQRAVKETNGFNLKDKPLVVVFAKSAV